jgi:hypothetical protein
LARLERLAHHITSFLPTALKETFWATPTWHSDVVKQEANMS